MARNATPQKPRSSKPVRAPRRPSGAQSARTSWRDRLDSWLLHHRASARDARDLSPELVQELYQRSIRYSVMELPFFGWIDNLPEPVQNPVQAVVRGIVSAAINAKVDFSVEMLWGEGGYDNTKMLQARAPSQPPIVLHPVTGEPTWFCNVHSHSSKLRKDRESM